MGEDQSRSWDAGAAWNFVGIASQNTGMESSSPREVEQTAIWRFFYGCRTEPYGMQMSLSRDRGISWNDETILRADGGTRGYRISQGSDRHRWDCDRLLLRQCWRRPRTFNRCQPHRGSQRDSGIRVANLAFPTDRDRRRLSSRNLNAIENDPVFADYPGLLNSGVQMSDETKEGQVLGSGDSSGEILRVHHIARTVILDCVDGSVIRHMKAPSPRWATSSQPRSPRQI